MTRRGDGVRTTNLVVAISLMVALAGGGAAAATFRTATPAEAVTIVTADDTYTRGLTPADLSIRLHLPAGGDVPALKAQYAGAIQPWSDAETSRLTAFVERHSDKLDALAAWLPADVLFIKASDAIDGGLPHTRANAIVFGPALPDSDPALEFLIFHELFHVLSRHQSGAVRTELYGMIGFERCARTNIPEALRDRVVSNPDVEDPEFTVAVEGRAGAMNLMPLLTAEPSRYDAARPSFPSYFQLVFLNMRRNARGACSLDARRGHTPVFAPDAVVDALLEKVGHNTTYLFHAEETLADNFAYLQQGRADLPDMWVIERLRARLARGPE